MFDIFVKLTDENKKKYSNKLRMKALVGKTMFRKNKKKRGTNLKPLFFHIYFSQEKSRELEAKELWDLEEFEGTWNSSREALVEVIEGKKLRKSGKEGKFHKSETKEKT